MYLAPLSLITHLMVKGCHISLERKVTEEYLVSFNSLCCCVLIDKFIIPNC